MKRLIVEKTIGGIRYGIKELTVEEIRLWLLRMERGIYQDAARPGLLKRLLVWIGMLEPLPAAAQDVVDLMLFDDMALLDVATLATLTRNQIGTLTPAQVRDVWEECKTVNADFFQMRRRLERIGQANQ